MRLRNGHRLTLVTLTCLSLLGSLPAIAASDEPGQNVPSALAVPLGSG